MSEQTRTVTPMQARFHEKRKDWKDRDIQMAQVYYLSCINEKLERNRKNTSSMVTWLIAMPLILGAIMFLLAIIGAA